MARDETGSGGRKADGVQPASKRARQCAWGVWGGVMPVVFVTAGFMCGECGK